MLYRARCARTHGIPAISVETVVEPLAVITRTSTTFAPGATPVYAPPEAVPSPATMPATWVPCPPGSAGPARAAPAAAAVEAPAGPARPAPAGRGPRSPAAKATPSP